MFIHTHQFCLFVNLLNFIQFEIEIDLSTYCLYVNKIYLSAHIISLNAPSKHIVFPIIFSVYTYSYIYFICSFIFVAMSSLLRYLIYLKIHNKCICTSNWFPEGLPYFLLYCSTRRKTQATTYV